jgi:hypothetical protein
MSVKPNTINLAEKGRPGIVRQIDVESAVFLHRSGDREASRITIIFHSGPYRRRLTLERRQEDRWFEGALHRVCQDTEELVEALPVRCALCDSLQQTALLLGATDWPEDGQVYEWMVHLDSVQRLIGPKPGQP